MIETKGFRPRILAMGVVGAPQISGDGKTVVWNQKIDDNVDIYRYQDGKVDRLCSDPRQDIHPRVNHDGSVITWSRFSTLDPNDKEGNFDVVVWKDGQEQTIAGSRANESDPVVSPDGSKIVWASDVDGAGFRSMVQCWEKGAVRDISVEGADFPVFAGNDSVIWRAGGELVRWDGQAQAITSGPGLEVKPAGTSDGRSVFYQMADEAGDDDLFRLDLASGQTEVVAGLKKVDEDWPSVSADGAVLAWTNFDRRGFGDSANTQIYVREQGENRQVTFGPGLHGQTSMSADGDKIVYQWINSAFLNHRAVVMLER